MDNNGISNRIDLLISLLGFRNASEFAESLGVSSNAITNWKKRGLKASSSSLARIKAKFPQVNEKWLLYGDGEMLYPAKEERKESLFNTEKIAESLNSSRVPNNNKGVPYFNFDFQMGFDPKILDNRTNPDAYFDITPYNNCTCWCNARGDSMHPTISSGDMVALKRVEDWSYLISGEVYGIVTTNGLRTIKRVKDRGDKLLLVPDNKEYEEQEIPKEVVMHIFLVKGVLKSF